MDYAFQELGIQCKKWPVVGKPIAELLHFIKNSVIDTATTTCAIQCQLVYNTITDEVWSVAPVNLYACHRYRYER